MVEMLSERFRNFAIRECSGSSELYEFLSLKIAEDKEMLELASYASKGQPIPNLLYGAVHYLLLKGKDHSLKEFYSSLVEKTRNIEESYIYFKDFCVQYRGEIIPILKTKIVQTNEVRRSSYLYPIFQYIFDMTKKPLALIEIGTSAGLQLIWDKYRYTYGTNEVYGDIHSQVLLSSEIKGENTPSLHRNMPTVALRIGMDLNILDLTNDEDYLWLMALIWADHNERRELFEKAAKCVKEHAHSLTFIQGDGVELLPDLVKEIPKEYTICVFHTHVANQMPSEVKQRLLEQVKSIGTKRDIFHIYNNIQDSDLHLDYWSEGKEFVYKVGKTDGHGRWFTWEL